MRILFPYLLIINAVAFALMLADKKKSIAHKWRIPEAQLLGIALIGGSAGAILAMYTFRHKTRHPIFYIGLPCLLTIQVIVLLVLMHFGIL